MTPDTDRNRKDLDRSDTDRRHADQQLDDLLRSLPRESPTTGFAARVVRATQDRSARPVAGRFTVTSGMLASAALAAAVVVAILVFGPMPRDASPGIADREAPTRDVADLEDEYQRLAAELEALETLRATARPVVYLGSGNKTDFVLDLDRLARRHAMRGDRATTSPIPIPDNSESNAGRLIPARYDGGNNS